MTPTCFWRVAWYNQWGYFQFLDFEQYAEAESWYNCLCKDYTVSFVREPVAKTVFDIIQQ